MAQTPSPQVYFKDIQDITIRKNFENLYNYFNSQNQLVGFNFLELVFTQAVSSQLVAHNLGFIPQDIVITKITGSGKIQFLHSKFTSAAMFVTATGPCRVRFYYGTYWNYTSNINNQATDVQQFVDQQASQEDLTVLQNSVASITKSSFFNPMTTLGDMIYGTTGGTGARLIGNVLSTKKFLTQTGTGTISAPPAWGTIAAADVPLLNQNTTGNAATATDLKPAGTATFVYTSNGALLAPTWQAAGTASPLTTKGDLYVFSTVNDRLPIGTDTWVLTADSTQPSGMKWAAISGGSGVTTLAAVGSSPNANAGTIASTTLTLQPANATFPGVVSTAAQAFAGMKEFISPVLMDENSTPSTPASTKHNLYFKSNGNLYMLNSAGFEVQLTGISATNTTDWVAYTPAISNGWGTVTSISFLWRRVGDSLEVIGTFTTAVCTANLCTIALPSGLNIDPTKLVINSTTGSEGAEIGQLFEGHSANEFTILVANTSTSTSVIYAGGLVNAANFTTPHNGNVISNNSALEQVHFKVPIVGWTGTGGFGTGLAGSNWMNNLTFTPSASFGTPTNTSIFYRQVGDTMHVRGYFTSGTTTASTAFITLPTGFTIDTTKIGTATRQQSVGIAYPQGTGNLSGTGGICAVFFDGSTTNEVFITFSTSGGVFTTSNASSIVGTGNSITFEFSVPISQWTANPYGAIPTQSARYHASATTISGSLATVVWTTKDYDSDNAMASGVYTCSVLGKFKVDVGLLITGTISLNNTFILEIQQNGTVVSRKTIYAPASITDVSIGLSDTLNCALNDTIRIQVSTSALAPSIVSSNFDNYIAIARVQ